MALAHQAVLLEEAVDALMAATTELADQVFVDGTFGRGGHSARILERLSRDDRLIAFDKDPEAARVAEEMAGADARFSFLRGSFAELERAGSDLSGVFLDLGVSSPQLDDRARGFSFQLEGPLDMRMDPDCGMSAADFVNTASQQEMISVFRDYGEERYAKRIASAIVSARASEPFATTAQLARIVSEANPSWEKHKHPATRVFQAIRIHVNQELIDLECLLGKVIDLLAVGGRLVVISFHSLEDRLVKQFMRNEARGKQVPRGVPVLDADRGQRLRLVGKPVKAGEAELAVNPRARSAIMRVAERIA
jgi:16S rRNA (cytosine1402-N4)-methyltransferase